MKKLPAVSEMEHITSKEFGENMDAILKRVAKEDVTLIIDHAGKSYVLCHARWFEVPELTQLEVMVKKRCAVCFRGRRFRLGRNSSDREGACADLISGVHYHASQNHHGQDLRWLRRRVVRDEAGIGRRPDEGKQGGTYGNTMIYYIADMHFGHENVIRFDDRPFRTQSRWTRC